MIESRIFKPCSKGGSVAEYRLRVFLRKRFSKNSGAKRTYFGSKHDRGSVITEAHEKQILQIENGM